MKEYKIYCTDEQTQKAYNLDAPLEIASDVNKHTVLCRKRQYHTYAEIVIPTGEEMIGWLENHKNITAIEITHFGSHWFAHVTTTTPGCSLCMDCFQTRKEATLVAIDMALNYLIKQKEKDERS